MKTYDFEMLKIYRRKHDAPTLCIKHGWGAVQFSSLVFLISFGHVRQGHSFEKPATFHTQNVDGKLEDGYFRTNNI